MGRNLRNFTVNFLFVWIFMYLCVCMLVCVCVCVWEREREREKERERESLLLYVLELMHVNIYSCIYISMCVFVHAFDFVGWLVGWFSWHINPRMLFNAKSCLHMNIKLKKKLQIRLLLIYLSIYPPQTEKNK